MRGFAPAYGSPLNYESISFHRAESSWTHLNDGIQCNFEPINATPNSTEIPRVATQIREEPKIHVPMSNSCHRLSSNPQTEKNFFSTQFSDV